MNPEHDKCKTQLYTPRIIYKENGKSVQETLKPYWWCKKCRCFVKLGQITQQEYKEES